MLPALYHAQPQQELVRLWLFCMPRQQQYSAVQQRFVKDILIECLSELAEVVGKIEQSPDTKMSVNLILVHLLLIK